jgi:predicted CoA-binding protein
MNIKKTLVLGASEKTERYSNKAIHMLRNHHMPVVAIGNKAGMVKDVSFSKEQQAFEDVDTVTLYLSAPHQKEYYDYIISLHPKRIIFNPGTENDELQELAKQHSIQCLEACTLVLLSTGQY